MPTIADQVTTVEHDLVAALAQIDALSAAKAALESANASLQRDNVGLQLEVNDMKHYVDDTRAMAETLANSALEMLRASRRQVGGQAEIIPYAPPARPFMVPGPGGVGVPFDPNGAALGGIDRTTHPYWRNANAPVGVAVVTEPNFEVDKTGKVHLLDTPAQRTVTEIMTSDSGDEHPEPTVFETMHADVTAPLGFIHCKDCPDPPRCVPGSVWCDTVKPGPMLVEHGPDGLPIFLRSPPAERNAVFG